MQRRSRNSDNGDDKRIIKLLSTNGVEKGKIAADVEHAITTPARTDAANVAYKFEDCSPT